MASVRSVQFRGSDSALVGARDDADQVHALGDVIAARVLHLVADLVEVPRAERNDEIALDQREDLGRIGDRHHVGDHAPGIDLLHEAAEHGRAARAK